MKQIIKLSILFFFPLITALCTYLILHYLFLSAYMPKSTETKLIIVKGDTKEIGKLLEDEKIIKHWWSFHTIAKLRSFNNKINIGEYELSAAMTPLSIVKKINKADVKVRELKIAPADTITKIIEKFRVAGIGTKEELEQKFYDKEYIVSLGIKNGTLEGRLFPSTYKFSLPITIEEMISKILEQEKKHWLPIYDQQAKFLGMDKEEILILASIIESECTELNIVKDQLTLRNVSATYHNRLKKELPLNAASTIYYWKPYEARPLTEEAKKQYSPFNTFLNIGLPPTPICSPSSKAIKAALYPTSGNFISFSLNPNNKSLYFIDAVDIKN